MKRAFLVPSLTAGAFPIILILALATAFVMGLTPKRDDLYPLHVDEWIHYQNALSIAEPVRPQALTVEGGFHLLLAQVRLVTGLDWFTIVRWLPPVFFAATVLLAYVAGRRFGCGLEGAFLAALVPTTIRFLGPAFLVPVALGLMALPILLFLLHTSPFGLREGLLCGLTLLFVGVTHPTSAVLLTTIVLSHAALMLFLDREVRLKRRLASLLVILVAIAVPAAIIVPWRLAQVSFVMGSLIEAGGATVLPGVRDAVSKFGSVPAGLAVFGIFLLMLGGRWQGYAVVAVALVLLTIITIYKSIYLGYQSLADRSWLHLLLLFGLLGGVAAAWLRSQLPQYIGRVVGIKIARTLGLGVAVALVIVSVSVGFKSRLAEFYYQLVTSETLADFQWIKENMSPTKRVAVLRTDLGLAYSPLTGGGAVYATEAWPFLNPLGRDAMRFLSASGPPADARWWWEREVRLIYAPNWSGKSAYWLDQPRPGVFIPAQLSR